MSSQANFATKRRAAFQKVGALKPRLQKQDFKNVAGELQKLLQVKPAEASQLWELAQPDETGQVNKSCIEELLDLIYSQQDKEIEKDGGLVEGLRFVLQTIFQDEVSKSVTLESIRQYIESSFENGGELIINKLQGISRGGIIRRIDLSNLIERLESEQLFEDSQIHQEETNNQQFLNRQSSGFQDFSTPDYQIDSAAPFSAELNRVYMNNLSLDAEAIARGIESCQHLNMTLQGLHSRTKNFPYLLSDYFKFSKKASEQAEIVSQQMERIQEEMDRLDAEHQQELEQSSQQVYRLQMELNEGAQKKEEEIKKAVQEAVEASNKALVKKDLEHESILGNLTEQVASLQTEMAQAHSGRSAALEHANSLENKLNMALSVQKNEKVQKMLEKAFDDADFYKHIMEAAEKGLEFDDDPMKVGEKVPKIEFDKVQAERDLFEKESKENQDFISILQKEIKELKQTIEEEENKATVSGFGESNAFRLSTFTPGSLPPSDPITDSRLDFNKSTFFEKPEEKVEPVELNFFTDIFYVKEGKIENEPNQNDEKDSLLSEIQTLKNQIEELKNEKKTQEDQENKISILQQDLKAKEAQIEKLKGDVSAKSIVIGNLTAQISSIQAQLSKLESAEPKVNEIVKYIEKPESDPDNCKPDYDLTKDMKKTEAILENNRNMPKEAKKMPHLENSYTESETEICYSGGKPVSPGQWDLATNVGQLTVPVKLRSHKCSVSKLTEEGFDFKLGYQKKVEELTLLKAELHQAKLKSSREPTMLESKLVNVVESTDVLATSEETTFEAPSDSVPEDSQTSQEESQMKAVMSSSIEPVEQEIEISRLREEVVESIKKVDRYEQEVEFLRSEIEEKKKVEESLNTNNLDLAKEIGQKDIGIETIAVELAALKKIINVPKLNKKVQTNLINAPSLALPVQIPEATKITSDMKPLPSSKIASGQSSQVSTKGISASQFKSVVPGAIDKSEELSKEVIKEEPEDEEENKYDFLAGLADPGPEYRKPSGGSGNSNPGMFGSMETNSKLNPSSNLGPNLSGQSQFNNPVSGAQSGMPLPVSSKMSKLQSSLDQKAINPLLTSMRYGDFKNPGVQSHNTPEFLPNFQNSDAQNPFDVLGNPSQLMNDLNPGQSQAFRSTFNAPGVGALNNPPQQSINPLPSAFPNPALDFEGKPIESQITAPKEPAADLSENLKKALSELAETKVTVEKQKFQIDDLETEIKLLKKTSFGLEKKIEEYEDKEKSLMTEMETLKKKIETSNQVSPVRPIDPSKFAGAQTKVATPEPTLPNKALNPFADDALEQNMAVPTQIKRMDNPFSSREGNLSLQDEIEKLKSNPNPYVNTEENKLGSKYVSGALKGWNLLAPEQTPTPTPKQPTPIDNLAPIDNPARKTMRGRYTSVLGSILTSTAAPQKVNNKAVSRIWFTQMNS